jgi:TolB-like protein/Flp pilus assembly protein TadD
MSGDKEQEYFSEGLTEELLNSLSRINELQVAARTSSFSFQGEHPDIATVAHKLNVSAVLEGSVRRSARTVRITAQLVNGTTGYHLWSQSYDRDLGDVLQLQTEIATAVAGALKVTLLGDVAAKIEAGGTQSPTAFDAYLRASQAYWASQSEPEEQSSIDLYSEAIRLDPNYALAFASRSIALADFARRFASGTGVDDNLAKAQADASKATALAPDLAEGHLALAVVLEERSLDYERAGIEFERAVALAPGTARVLRNYGVYASRMGHAQAGLAATRRVIVLDPLSSNARVWLCHQLFLARRYTEAVAACRDTLALNPRDIDAPGLEGFANYALGNFQGARSSCEQRVDSENAQICLAVTYNRLGQRADADSMRLKLRAWRGDAAAYHFARIYAQWGNAAEALNWLDTAMRLHSPLMVFVKTDPLIDPIRNEPRFHAIERELKFPD